MLEAGARAVQSTPLVSGARTVVGVISTQFGRRTDRASASCGLWISRRERKRQTVKRQETEEVAQALSAELKQILDTSATGLTHCSRELCYVSANPAYAKIAGLPWSERRARSIAEVMGETAFATILPYIERALRGGRVNTRLNCRGLRAASAGTMSSTRPARKPTALSTVGSPRSATSPTRRRAEQGSLRKVERNPRTPSR